MARSNTLQYAPPLNLRLELDTPAEQPVRGKSVRRRKRVTRNAAQRDQPASRVATPAAHSFRRGELAQHEQLIDALADEFFTAAIGSPRTLADDAAFDFEWTVPPATRAAMYVTVGLLVIAAIALVSFCVYTRVLMPVPVELGTLP